MSWLNLFGFNKKSLELSVKFRKLSSEARTPKYANQGDAAMDLVALTRNMSSSFIEYGTGIAIEIPDGYVGLLFPRSSITKTPKGVSLKNSVGVIDSSYRGEILVRFNWPYPLITSPKEYENMPKIGDKIAQLVILPYPKIKMKEVTELSDTSRGDGGFGSTDKK